MIHSRDIKAQQSQDTGLALVLVFLILSLVTEKILYVLPAVILQVVTMIVPSIFGPLSYLWFGLSKHLGNMISKIFLTLIFFLVVFPIGILRKIFGSDSMKLKSWKQQQKSMFVDRNHTYVPSDLEEPY